MINQHKGNHTSHTYSLIFFFFAQEKEEGDFDVLFLEHRSKKIKKDRKKNRETKNKRCFCFVKFSVEQAAEST